MCFSDSSGVTSTDSNDSSCEYSYCNDNKINLVQTSSDTANTSSTHPHLSTLERGGSSQHRPTCLDGVGKSFLDILLDMTFRDFLILLFFVSLFFCWYFFALIEFYLSGNNGVLICHT